MLIGSGHNRGAAVEADAIGDPWAATEADAIGEQLKRQAAAEADPIGEQQLCRESCPAPDEGELATCTTLILVLSLWPLNSYRESFPNSGIENEPTYCLWVNRLFWLGSRQRLQATREQSLFQEMNLMLI